MQACPKFDGCSAPICPLDADWPRRIHRKGEPVCFYLLEYVKPGSRARFEGRTAVFLYELMESSIGRLCSRHAPLRRAVERAKRTGSRMNSGTRGARDPGRGDERSVDSPEPVDARRFLELLNTKREAGH